MESLKYSRLVAFFNAANAYIEKNGERSSVTFALNKLIMHYRTKIENIRRDWQEEVNAESEDIRVKYCEKDKDTGVFKEKIYGEGANLVTRRMFTAEKERLADREIQLKAREIEDKWMNHEVTIKTHFVPVPANMDIKWIEAFSDFIFHPMSDEELENHHLAQGKNELELLPN